MTNILKFAGVAIVGVVIGYLANGSHTFGGVYNQVQKYFPQGLYVGTTNQLSVSSAGAVSTSGAVVTSATASIATTSTSRMLNVGAGGSATTTIDIGKACFQITTDNGTVMYAWFRSGNGAIGALATSSTSCF